MEIKKAIEQLKDLRKDRESFADFHEPDDPFVSDIAAIDTAISVMNARKFRWIPCSERMPEDGQRVLICTGMRKEFVAAYNRSAQMFLQRVHQTIHSWYGYEVSHWMPMPEPPGGDNDVGQNADNR